MPPGAKQQLEMISFDIELLLVNISNNVYNDGSGAHLKTRVDEIFSFSDSAQSFLFQKAHDEEASHTLKKQVLRFVKIPDKYISLTSILLKSQAFYKTHFSMLEKGKHPIIEIPRTEYNKPYIPTNVQHDSFPEANLYPFSISHQYPFVGMARLIINSASEHPSNRPLVGLDIVTFEDYNPKLYSNTREFLSIFRDYFTSWEWGCIHKNDELSLKEFYLYWAIKEAYTKALGVGMGLPFDSFETHLDDIDGGIFSWLCNKGAAGEFLVKGSVIIKSATNDSQTDNCIFAFLPLWNQTSILLDDVSKDVTTAHGFACVCILKNAQDNKGVHLSTAWNTMEELVKWHYSEPALV